MSEAYLHRGGAEPLLGETIDARLGAVVARFPDREAVVSVAQGRRLTYAALDRAVQRLAKGLLALGLGRGNRVGVWATDNLEWVLLQLATARVGAVLVNVNPAYRAGELEHALKTARVEALFLIPRFRSSDYVGMVRTLCPELETEAPGALEAAALPELRAVVVYDAESPDETARPCPGMHVWSDVLAAGEAMADAELARLTASLDRDNPINIQFTSGTTGFPKAVELTHHNLVNNAWFIGDAMRFTETDRLCVPVPFYHCFGMVLANLACLLRGAAIVIPSAHFDAGATLDAIEAERCTAVHGVPTMFVAELEALREQPRQLTSLRTGIMAGAPCPPELMRKVMEDLGCREILIAYGQTEASPVTHITHADDSLERRTQTVGTNLPHQEVKVVDTTTGATVRRGETGEVCFRGYHVMRGYFENPTATAQAIDAAGWLHSGDIGAMDADGYLRITGRLKDMIIRGGENVYPAEIEAFYYQHPQVKDIAVFGVPDPRMGEEIGAWIQLHAGETSTPEALRDWAREKIAHFKVPRYVWIVDDFPMTVTGKIQKYKIRELAAAELAAAAQPAASSD